MCFRRILQKMGQFRTYNDITLSKRLVRAEQNLTELNANQQYLMQSVVGFESNKITSTFDERNDGGWISSGWNGMLTFTADKPKKDVVFTIKFVCYDANGNEVSISGIGGSDGTPWVNQCSVYKTGGASNVCYGFLDVFANRQGSSLVKTIKIWVVANDKGFLSIDKKAYEFA